MVFYYRTLSTSAAPARLERCAALRIVLVTVPRVSRSCDCFSGGFDLYRLLLPAQCSLQQPQHPVSIQHETLNLIAYNPFQRGFPPTKSSQLHHNNGKAFV